MPTNPPVAQIRAPITNDIQAYLQRQFAELPLEIAERVQEAFGAILADPHMDEMTKPERDARDVERGYTNVAKQWDEATPEARNKAAIAADESADLQRRYQAYAEEKRAAGRYTLEEAAKAIADTGETSDKQMLAKLELAAFAHALSTYLPGHNSKTKYGQRPGETRNVSTFYDECYWDDLNEWLDSNDNRINFRFNAPQGAAAANTKTRQPWDKYRLKKLLDKYKDPGMNQGKLADKEGVSRQRIGELLKQARDEWEPKKTSAISVFAQQGKK